MACREIFERAHPMQDAGAVLEIAMRGHVEPVADQRRVVLAQHRLQLARSPDVELALFALAVRVLGGPEGSLGRSEIALYIREHLTCGLGEFGAAGRLVGLDKG